jgi:TATA-box binding protein (TBP) (component of TFIID and TFIIIB)
MTQIELATQVQTLKSSFENAQMSKEEFKALVYSLFEQGAMADVYKTYSDLNLQPIFSN